ncbi:MAG TPA: ABC transporter permease [Acidobacteriota bacterium]|nr:ABC transporter permease [Acidobacteriota bacterium]
MRGLVQDLKVAYRQLVKNGLTTVASLATLALGIGASTAIFSVVEGVLLRPLPYPQPDQIVRVWRVNDSGRHGPSSDPNYKDWTQWSSRFQAWAQYRASTTSVSGGKEPVRTRVATVEADFFPIMGVEAALGRTFAGESLSTGSAPVAVVSQGFWRRMLEGNRDLSSLKLNISNTAYSIIGVMPPEFNFPQGSEIWIPRELLPVNNSRTSHNWYVIARLKEDSNLRQAQAEMEAIGRRQVEMYGDDTWLVDIDVVPLQEELVGDYRTRLWVLLGAVGILLLVGCFNIVNILLAQSSGRRRELAVRSALGAGRWKLARQFVTETLLLSIAGAALGVIAAHWGLQFLLSLEPGDLPRLEEIQLNLPVLAFASGLALLIGLLLGLLPVFQFRGANLASALQQGSRTYSGGPGRARARGALVVIQVAVTLVLLVGAGLLLRSFQQLISVEPGFDAEGGLVLYLSRAFPGDEAESRRLAQVNTELMERLGQIPGVEGVGGITGLPLSNFGNFADGLFLIDNEGITAREPYSRELVRRFEEAGNTGYGEFRVASDGYFQAMGIPLVRGRLFQPSDGPDAPHVAVISQSLAQSLPGSEPLGQRIQFGNMDGTMKLLTVVGIVGDVRDRSLEMEPRPTIYLNQRQRPRRTANFTILLDGDFDPSSVTAQARAIIQDIDPNLPVQFERLEAIFSSSLSGRRFSLILLGIFAASALLLAAVGIFGMMAFTVNERLKEIGIRMALGADPRRVHLRFIRQAALLTAIGIALGALAALGLARSVESMLHQVSARDPLTFAAAAPLILVVALAACYIPARRAVRVDPLQTLREE